MDSSSIPSVTLASRSVKLAKSYFEDVGKEFGAKAGSLSSTLDKLYAWEKRLYKEVKASWCNFSYLFVPFHAVTSTIDELVY